MSFHYSPKITTDGLIFFYDMNNEKKSYLGKPTTNFITNGDFTGKANAGTGGTGGDNPLNEIVEASNPGDSPYCLRSTAVGGNIYTEYQMDLTTELVANTTYVMSCWYTFSPDWNGSSAVFHSRAFSSSGANVATGADAGTAIETRVINGTTWTRAYQTITTPADYSNAFNWYLGYPSSNTAGYRYFTNIQMELGSYPTPFTRTSRSSTTALKDLTNRNTITVNSLTYANNRTTSPSFNGTSDYVTLNNNSYDLGITRNATYSCWIKPTSTTAMYGISDYGTNALGMTLRTNSNLSADFYVYPNNHRITYTYAFDANIWYNLVGVMDGANMYMYLNGVLVGSQTLGEDIGNSSNKLVMGGRGDAPTGLGTGQVGAVMIHNRSLTPSEILQNFNAHRGRYGV